MEQAKKFSTQALVVVLVFNGVLTAALYLLGGEAMRAQALAAFGVGLVLSLALWFTLQQIARRLMEQVRPGAPTPEAVPQAPPKPEPAKLGPPPEAGAVQLLSILQRKGRLVDFLQEDLSQYADAQIGAAVRNVHEGCKQALAEYVDLEPIFTEAEGSAVTVAPGFDAHAIRLTGNIVGDPPFKGALRHRGWRVARVDLPKLSPAQQKERVVAAAEVEVS
jgi:hypothetical protein